MHVFPKVTRETPTQQSNVRQLRQVRSRHLADPRLNVPARINILLAADVFEDAMLDNQMKDNGVVIRESISGWIVSGPLQEPELEDENAIFAKVSIILSSGNTAGLILKF